MYVTLTCQSFVCLSFAVTVTQVSLPGQYFDSNLNDNDDRDDGDWRRI